MNEARRTDHHRDAAATRRRILDAARARFAGMGYRATSVREVAADAGVSPNLITRYFGGKEGLFLAAAEPMVAGADVFGGDREGFGERLARSILARWTGMLKEDPLLVLLRAAGERPDAAKRLADFLDENTTAPLQRWLVEQGLPRQVAHDRAEAIDALILGTTVRRRVLSDDLGDTVDLARWLGSALQALAAP